MPRAHGHALVVGFGARLVYLCGTSAGGRGGSSRSSSTSPSTFSLALACLGLGKSTAHGVCVSSSHQPFDPTPIHNSLSPHMAHIAHMWVQFERGCVYPSAPRTPTIRAEYRIALNLRVNMRHITPPALKFRADFLRNKGGVIAVSYTHLTLPTNREV